MIDTKRKTTLPYLSMPIEVNRQFYPPPANSVLYLTGYPPLGATITDHSGQGNHGTITGATWTRLPGGLWGLDFNGTSNYVDIANPTSFQFTTSFSVSLWVKMDTMVTAAKPVNVFIADWNGWFLGVEGATAVYAFEGRESVGSTRIFKVLTPTITLGVWYHIAAVYDSVGNTARIYYNADFASVAASGTITYTGVTKATIASRQDPSGLEFFDGQIDLPRILNVALSATQIANGFNQERHLFGV